MNFNLESRLDAESQKEIGEMLKRFESGIHVHFSGSLYDRFVSLLNHYQRQAAESTSLRKSMIEDTITYLQSFKMLCEMVGMGQTHGEKAARLRGMIQLVDSSITKLRRDQTNDILSNWQNFGWGFSDYPYQSILDNYDRLKRENEDLKIKVNELENNQKPQ